MSNNTASASRTIVFAPKGTAGSRGPALRGPREWPALDDGAQLYAGAESEPYIDVVIHNGYYYYCKTTHTKNGVYSEPGGKYGDSFWQLGDRLDLVATQVLLSKYAVIKNLGAEAIEMKDADGNVIFEAKDGNVTCRTGTFNNVIVQTGQVAGFEISGNALINKGFNSDSYMVIRNDDESVFMGVGANVLPPSQALHKACGRFENGVSNSSGYNYGLIAAAKNAANNIAIHLGGGCISGFALRNQIVSGTTTTYIERGVNSVIGVGNGNVNIYLPKLDSCDDGYIVRFQSLKDTGAMRIYTQNCTTPSGNGRAAIICYVDGRYTTLTTSYFDLSAPGYAMELMWVRDLTVTVSGTTYRGCWLQYKMPRDW